MTVREALSQCAQGIKGLAIGAKDFAVNAAKWGARTVVTIAQYTAATVQKIVEFVTPYLKQFKDFLVANQPTVLAVVIAAGVGAAITALVCKLCCTSEEPSKA